ncbi:hypothetical protein BC835DRAFT_1412016 [Cytidiella melzeri]|nr:hypothetical protein BC835DRAFT_1412016 [Cytidiella melzeri]
MSADLVKMALRHLKRTGLHRHALQPSAAILDFALAEVLCRHVRLNMFPPYSSMGTRTATTATCERQRGHTRLGTTYISRGKRSAFLDEQIFLDDRSS